jgi:hypothetical protein
MRAFASLFALVLAGVALASPADPRARKALSLTRRHAVTDALTCRTDPVERAALVLAQAAPLVLARVALPAPVASLALARAAPLAFAPRALALALEDEDGEAHYQDHDQGEDVHQEDQCEADAHHDVAP